MDVLDVGAGLIALSAAYTYWNDSVRDAFCHERVGALLPGWVARREAVARIGDWILRGAWIVGVSAGVIVGAGLFFARPATGVEAMNEFTATFVAVWTTATFMQAVDRVADRLRAWGRRVIEEARVRNDLGRDDLVEPNATVFLGTFVFWSVYFTGFLGLLRDVTPAGYWPDGITVAPMALVAVAASVVYTAYAQFSEG